MKSEISKNKLVKNSWWGMIQQAYLMPISLIVGVLTARYLGPEKYGMLAIVGAVIAFSASISWLGIDSIIINELILNREKNNEYIGTAITIKVLMSSISIALSYVVVRFLYEDKYITIVLLIQGAAFFFQFYEIFRYWFQSNQDFKYISVVMMISKTIVAIYQLTLIALKKSVLWFATVYLLNDLLLCAFISWKFHKETDYRIRFSIEECRRLLSKSYHFVISSIAITLYMQVDKIMIGKMLSTSEVGIYNAAVNISTLWQFIPIAIINAARPIIIEKKKKDELLFWDIYKKTISTIVYISIFICLIISVLARPIVYVLYGSDYMLAVAPLRICVWATAIAMVGVIRGIWLIACNYNKYDKYFTVIAAVLNVLINVFAIDAWGIKGAAIATVISYFVEVFVINYLFDETRAFNAIFLKAIKDWKTVFSYFGSLIKQL